MHPLRPSSSPLLPAFLFSLALPSLAACDAAADDPSGDPGHMADLVGAKLADVAVGVDQSELAYRLFDLGSNELVDDVTQPSCDEVDARLASVCDDLWSSGDLVGNCDYQTIFMYAHEVPRCAVRFTLTADGLPSVYATDFSGAPLTGTPPACGDGVLGDGEACDDGNLEAWDGCDPTCQVEPFQGCEAVIEQIYADAGIADVPAATWRGVRSHLMVNDGVAVASIDDATCDRAIALGSDACAELVAQMPFVSDCVPTGELHGDACTIRLQVGFASQAPDAGVFSTALDGLLAFTIR